eukprot:SM000270S10367  [mRNA]  locus=s270:99767:104222:+ [translate_table: standard]
MAGAAYFGPAPPGWTKKLIPRKKGCGVDVYFYTPDGTCIRSRRQLLQFLATSGLDQLPRDFDWGKVDVSSVAAEMKENQVPATRQDEGVLGKRPALCILDADVVARPVRRRLIVEDSSPAASTACIKEASVLQPKTADLSGRPTSVGSELRLEEQRGSPASPLLPGTGFLDFRGNLAAAKKALHLSERPEQVICREEEQRLVGQVVRKSIEQLQPCSLYMCGCPGTGKSLTVEAVRADARVWAQACETPLQEVFINCMALQSPQDIYRQILADLGHPSHLSTKPERLDPLAAVRQMATTGAASDRQIRTMMLLILDEVDQLAGRDSAVLIELFRLPVLPHSRCILIGIANVIDLQERLLPSLRSFPSPPQVIAFAPYTKEQIIAILKQRLSSLTFPVIAERALELCARKVGAASGDLRKALSICRDAVQLLELDNSQASPQTVLMTRQESPLSPGSPMMQRQVQIHHMSRALSTTFRSPVVDIIQGLPQHQQASRIILCATVRLFRKSKKDATLGEVVKAYADLCRQLGLHCLTAPEISSLSEVLADQALVTLGSSKDDTLRRVTLKVPEEDICFALQCQQHDEQYVLCREFDFFTTFYLNLAVPDFCRSTRVTHDIDRKPEASYLGQRAALVLDCSNVL